MKITRRQLRQIIKESISKSITSQILIPPPPDDTEEELNLVIDQYSNRKAPSGLQRELDENMSALFDNEIIKSGKESAIEKINKIKKENNNLIKRYKDIFNRARPTQYAESLGMDWSGDDDKMGTTNSPSYPSGHAFQGYFIALNLKDDYPNLETVFMKIARNVAQSRVDRGVHYPSDIKAGKDLAYKIYNQRKLK